MQLKTSHVIWGIVALVVLGNGDRIAGSLDEAVVQQRGKSAASAERKHLKQQAREAQKNSAIALDRAKAGCIQIWDTTAGVQDFFNEGEQVLDPITEQPIQQGFVCNQLGVTGVLKDGVIADLVMVSPADKIEYLGYLSLQKGGH